MLAYQPIGGEDQSGPGPIARFLKTIREVDDLLTKVEQMMVASRAHSPFNDYLTQLNDEQTKAMNIGIGELRAAILCLVRRTGVTMDAPHLNTAAAMRQTLASVAEKLTEAGAIVPVNAWERHSLEIDETEKLVVHMKGVVKRLDGILA